MKNKCLLGLVICLLLTPQIVFGGSDMDSAEYWTAKVQNADMVLMTPSEIERLNARNCTIEANNLCDLTRFPSLFNQKGYFEKVFSRLSSFDGAEYALPQQTLLAMDENLGRETLSYGKKTEYGVVLCRTKVRIYPLDAGVYEDGDTLFDYNLESVLLPNEAVLILGESRDKKFCFVRAQNTQGYVLQSDIAKTRDLELWKAFAAPRDFYVVSDNKYGEYTMGVRFPLDKNGGALCAVSENGQLGVKKLDDVSHLHRGYLPFTQKNILTQLFKCIDDVYGWGGDFNSRDCSSYTSEVYRTFGLFIGRNVSNQICCGLKHIDLSTISSAEKEKLMASMPCGTLVAFGGHVMVYIGTEGGKPYIIHSVYGYGDKENRTIANRVAVSDCDIIRTKNGQTFMENLSDAVIFTKENIR